MTIDQILDYVIIQMLKPIPSDIREEIVTLGNSIVKSEAKAQLQELIDAEVLRGKVEELEKMWAKEFDPRKEDDGSYWYDGFKNDDYIRDRIATLKKESKDDPTK